MIFDYEINDYINADGNITQICRPVLDINLIKRGAPLLKIPLLIDSGADIIVLPLDIAKYFEIPYKKGIKVPVNVAGGDIVYFYRVPYELHKITISICGVEVKESIDFSEGQKMALLGQDFFKYFKISFEREKLKFSLEQN